MAYRDGTGPEGLGPLTGRRLGNCSKEDASKGIPAYYGGYGIGRRAGGRGMGRGMGRCLSRPFDRQASLKNEKELLKQRLAEIENLIEKIE